MSASWFDESDDNPTDQMNPSNDSSATCSDDESSEHAKGVWTAANNRVWLAIAVGLVMLACLSVFGVTRSIQSRSDGVAPVSILTSVTAPPVVSSSVESVVTLSSPAPQKCPDQPKADAKTAAGAVVIFQKAYFSGDVKALEKVIAPGSHLVGVDWPTAAGELVGSDFCVKASNVSGAVVDADTTVRTVDGEELLFLQKITTTKVEGEYKIWTIEDRPQPTKA